jgi:outer membrane protein OmpA-like peptidoglycan-associated protein
MKSKILIRYVICFVLFLFCNVVLYAEEKNNLDKAVFHFDVSSTEISIREQDIIKRMAQKVSCLNLRVLIESNTDITGNDEINVPLSQERAEIIRISFMSLGIPEDYIQIISYASSNPIDSNNTPEAYFKNRRTEVTLIDPKKEEFPRIVK